MTDPNKALLDDSTVPRATLAGREWPIPPMALKQKARVVPLIIRSLLPLMTESGGVDAMLARLTSDVIEDLAEVCFVGLQRGHKTLTRDEFEELPIEITELPLVAIVVGRQAGILRPPKPGETPSGESPGSSATGAT